MGSSDLAARRNYCRKQPDRRRARLCAARYRVNLWLLGGELIRRRHDDDKIKKMPLGKAIAELIEEEGGPLIWPRVTEAQQNSFDATCRKLYKYLNSADKFAG